MPLQGVILERSKCATAAPISLRTGESNMADKNRDKNRQSGTDSKRGDSESSLQKELRRESAEGADSVGDVGSNRTLSGSSTWETLPSGGKTPAVNATPNTKKSKKPQGSGTAPKKRR
jgi:hypothetical protein